MDKENQSNYWSAIRPIWWEEIKSWFGWGSRKQTMTNMIIAVGSIALLAYGGKPDLVDEEISVRFATMVIGVFWLLTIIFFSYISSNKILHKKNIKTQEYQILEISQLKESAKITHLPKVKLTAERYFYPFYVPKTVGITIRNLEQHDLTDVYLKLVQLKQTQFHDASAKDYTSILIRIDKNNCLFDLGDDSIIRAEDERAIRLGEIRGNEISFLLKNPFSPNRVFSEQQSGIHMSNPIWELDLELHGKIQGSSFPMEFFVAQIYSERIIKGTGVNAQNNITISIGEILHAEQD
jgi:hypothetical protein